MSFIWEKLLSTEAVRTGIERQMFARVLMLGNIVISISLVVSSVNWEYRVPFGCFDRFLRNVFHSVQISGDMRAFLVYSSPSTVSQAALHRSGLTLDPPSHPHSEASLKSLQL